MAKTKKSWFNYFSILSKENVDINFSMIKHSPMNCPLIILLNTFHWSWGHPKDKWGRGLFFYLMVGGRRGFSSVCIQHSIQWHFLFCIKVKTKFFSETDRQSLCVPKSDVKTAWSTSVGHCFTGICKQEKHASLQRLNHTAEHRFWLISKILKFLVITWSFQANKKVSGWEGSNKGEIQGCKE